MPVVVLRRFAAPDLPIVLRWFAHRDQRVFAHDLPARELELLQTMPGTEYRGARVLARHAWVADDETGVPVGLLGAEIYDRAPFLDSEGQPPPARANLARASRRADVVRRPGSLGARLWPGGAARRRRVGRTNRRRMARGSDRKPPPGQPTLRGRRGLHPLLPPARPRGDGELASRTVAMTTTAAALAEPPSQKQLSQAKLPTSARAPTERLGE